MSRYLRSDRDADAVQALKCLLNLDHDWNDNDLCEYCGAPRP
jgi:hypothetical protein